MTRKDKLLNALAWKEPAKFGELSELLEYERKKEEKERCEGSFIEFFKRAWREVDSAQLSISWHHLLICEYLEKIAYGEIRNLIINIPPRPVAEDQLVLERARGLVALREIEVGDYVLTHRRRWRRVTGVYEQGELECLRIVTRRGRELDLAPDHPVLTPEGWQAAWQLRTDDVIGVVPGRPAGRKDLVTEAEARLLGYLIGDGSVGGGTPNVTAASDGVTQDVMRCALIIGFIPRVQEYGWKARRVSLIKGEEWVASGTHVRVALLAKQEGAGRKGRARGAPGWKGPVRQWLTAHELDGKNSYTKRVPPAIMRGSDEVVRAFLGAYWSCDGYIARRGAKKDGVQRDDLLLGCGSVNRDLMLDIQQLLTRLGIASSLRRKTAKITTKRQGEGYVSYALAISDQDNAARFARLITLAHEKDDRIRQARRRRFDFDHDIWGEVVASVTSIERKQCRCLTVEGDQSFTANGIAVHNCTKSILVNVLFPAWSWCQPRDLEYPLIGPQVKFLSISYGATLSEEIALKMLRLVRGEWYRSHWGDRVKILSDQTSRANFGNDRGGERISNSIEGGLIGRGGDCIIVDDPHSLEGAESAAQRETTIRSFREGLSTRITDPRIAARILIMQRLHESDCTNEALETWPLRDTVHLMLPMRFDPVRAHLDDPRTREGELLWPEMWTEEAVAREELDLGPYASSGQLGQIPTPRVGGIVDRSDWRVYPEEPPDPSTVRRTAAGQIMLELPEVSYVILALDTAMSEQTTADWNAVTVWGVWHRRRNQQINPIGIERPWFASRWSGVQDPQRVEAEVVEEDDQPRAIMMEAWRRRCKLNDDTPDKLGKPQGLVQRVLETARRRKVDKIIIENKTRGKDVRDELVRQMRGEEFGIEMFEPGRHGDKVARLYSVQPLFSQGLVYAPGNYEIVTDATGKTYCEVREELVWVNAVLAECAGVPKGRHDDLADTAAMSLIWLRENGFLELTQAYIKDQVRNRLWRPKTFDPAMEYGVR